jgi:hypothetical protein
MEKKYGRAGDIYFHTTASDREWVNPGQIPIFKKLFAEFDAINQRLNKLETSLVYFANTHQLQHNGTLESVIGALCAEIQVIRTGKPYLAVSIKDNVINGITKPNQLIVEQPLPKYVIDTYYTVENGTIVENQQQKELLKGVLL